MVDVVITEFMDQSAVDDLSKRFAVLYAPELVDQAKIPGEVLADARAIIVRNRTQVRQALLDMAPNLEVVGRLGVGLDNIDMDACSRRGVRVYPATGANDIAVAEYVITTALVLARNAYNNFDQIIAGQWPRQGCIGREIYGQTLGLIGCGNIARETAKRAHALGMDSIAYDPYVGADDAVWSCIRRAEKMDEVISVADIISLHVPLTDATRNLIDANLLSRMKPGVLLINTARGGIIDEIALIEAMKSGRVRGAAIDVFANEPVNEKTGQLFSGVPNLILTPHIAGVTEQSNVRVSAMIANLVAEFLGEAS